MGPGTERLRALRPGAAVLTDFDGTLAPIVDDPATARPLPGVAEVLARLADEVAVVGVVSGRPVSFLAAQLTDPRLHLVGLYGFEARRDGLVSEAGDAARWVGPVASAATDLRRELDPAVRVEEKRLSITVHFRGRTDLADPVTATVAEVARRHGLDARPARMAVEVHPPNAPDKGTVVEDLAAGAEAVCFLGDDVGDLPAFDALDRLSGRGRTTVRVAVRSPETSPRLVERADVVVDGPAGALAWLRSLL